LLGVSVRNSGQQASPRAMVEVSKVTTSDRRARCTPSVSQRLHGGFPVGLAGRGDSLSVLAFVGSGSRDHDRARGAAPRELCEQFFTLQSEKAL
jgi:hypothetical protein